MKGGERMVREYEPLYTVKEVSKILRTNASTVYDLINQNKIPALRLGMIKIRGSDLERFIETFPTENMKEDSNEKENQSGARVGRSYAGV